MGRFQINAEFGLDTRLSPEGIRFDRGIDAEEFSDDSNYGEDDVEVSGGSLSFVVEADSQEDADRRSTDVIWDGMEVEDDNGFTWTVASLNIEIEQLDEPMTGERAKALIAAYLDREAAAGRMDEETREAFEFVLNLIPVA